MNAAALKKEMFKGFNTYYNNNVLAHLLMPECFMLSTGFKCYALFIRGIVKAGRGIHRKARKRGRNDADYGFTKSKGKKRT